MKDIGQGHAAYFRSKTLVDVSNRDSRRLNAKLTAYLLDPDPNDPNPIYATNIGGTCDDLWVNTPMAIQKEKHFEEDQVTKRYSSNATPKGTIVDLHRGEFSSR